MNDNGEKKVVETTPGRVILHKVIPNQVPFDMFNKNVEEKRCI